jgi:hypothetical protein
MGYRLETLPLNQQMFLLIQLQHVSAQLDHRQLVLDNYTNDDGILQNYKDNVNLLVKY